MRTFNRTNKGGSRFGGKSSGGSSFGGREFGSDRDARKSQMHKARCDECGNTCEVPFRPTGDKPLYCNSCFKGKGNSDSRGYGGRDSVRIFRKPNFDDKGMYKAKCDECGNTCEVPFRPTEGKPIYCDQCFGKGGTKNIFDKKKTTVVGGGENVEQIKKQFDLLNLKLDQILKVLNTDTTPTKVVAKKEQEKTTEKTKTSEPKKKVVAKKVATKKVVKKK